jgi:acetolactate decarboxylase
MKLRFWFASLWFACIAQAGSLFQVSTLQALMEGRYDGVITVAELKEHGAFGLGTFHALEGEMIYVNGRMYQVLGDGTVVMPAPETGVPFACVADIKLENAIEIRARIDLDEFRSTLDGRYTDSHVPLAIYMTGTFSRVQVRSVPAQEPPYPPLPDVIANQAVFDGEDIAGELVGFRMPDFWAGVNAPGYHFHFVSADRTFGGHVLDMTADGGLLFIQELKRAVLTLHRGD